MFGLDFLFASALFALPLAGLPVLLHLLFRKKSPVVPFSSVRFVRSSMQRTAARRKLQRWLLLACRALLLLLLIWAIAQPAHHVASNWFGGAKSPIAAIVVDTSYSMQLKDQETPLLDRAGAAVQSLLREQLAGARVALFRSVAPPAGQPEVLRDAGDWLTNWSPLQPTPERPELQTRLFAPCKQRLKPKSKSFRFPALSLSLMPRLSPVCRPIRCTSAIFCPPEKPNDAADCRKPPQFRQLSFFTKRRIACVPLSPIFSKSWETAGRLFSAN